MKPYFSPRLYVKMQLNFHRYLSISLVYMSPIYKMHYYKIIPFAKILLFQNVAQLFYYSRV
jgi:hypothetical protein